jgi:valyl-tRNA synthetase
MDLLHYIQENESSLISLINANQIEYVDQERGLQKYMTETIIDVTIGIKGISKVIKSNGIYEYTQEVEKKQEELQYLRNITGKLSLDKANKKQIEKNKEAMLQLKKDIEKLEYEISKLRMNDR